MRVNNEDSIHKKEKPENCPTGDHALWRTIYCNGDRDVVECSRCGQQKEVRCNFDDEYC